jgi:uncharacterized iron-regulated membrane protein
VLRKACFQVHSWVGLTIGLYVVVICLTGSVLVFRTEVYAYFRPWATVVPTGARMDQQALAASAMRAYPGLSLVRVQIKRREPAAAADVWLDGRGPRLHRLFNPYTGADLGDAEPRATRAFEWISDLHDNLLTGLRGRSVNGIGGLAAMGLGLSGLVVWWPARGHWRRSVLVRRHQSWTRMARDFHGALGFWSAAMVLMWALTGVYLAHPEPFQAVVDAVQQGDLTTVGWGDQLLAWFTRIHFGRFAGAPVKMLWALFGLAPAALFVTGAVMWWNRGTASRAGAPGRPLAPR